MIEQSIREMKDSCHLLAEHLMRINTKTNRNQWVRQYLVDLLLDEGNIEELAALYDAEYPYADAPTEYLAEVLKAYDQEVR